MQYTPNNSLAHNGINKSALAPSNLDDVVLLATELDHNNITRPVPMTHPRYSEIRGRRRDVA